MITVTQNISQVSLSAKIDKALKEKAEPVIKSRLIEIAGTLTALSPVWSGAYVTSHSFVPKGSGGGRSRISYYDKGPVNENTARDIGFEQLVQDINSVDFMDAKGGVFRNRSPSARLVEDGKHGDKKMVYGAQSVYRTTAARYRNG